MQTFILGQNCQALTNHEQLKILSKNFNMLSEVLEVCTLLRQLAGSLVFLLKQK